ncbi:hypothetical protein [Saccharopolyspora gloriosae]|uniref:hypothetical protein n=1 Tax=Saccharopolyspora gloriosae TaxID=455344 RepID=UPI001FB72181|nr:hypothetical protein [Saccharopolyspora gloriosae]
MSIPPPQADRGTAQQEHVLENICHSGDCDENLPIRVSVIDESNCGICRFSEFVDMARFSPIICMRKMFSRAALWDLVRSAHRDRPCT